MGDVVAQHGSLPTLEAQADFYAKLARLEIDVRSGKHPRITLPPAAIRALATLDNSGQQSPSSQDAAAVSANGIASTEKPTSNPPTQSSLPAPITHKLPPKPANALQPLETKPFSPAFDPVLLTKSDQLIRAETALKRQKLERSLKSAAEARRTVSRDKDWGAWTGPHLFDASEVLARANALVKPVSGLRARSTNKPSPPPDESFDEDSYYSSRHNSWSTERGGNINGIPSQQDLTRKEKDIQEPDESAIDKPTALPPRVSGLGPPALTPNEVSPTSENANKPTVNSHQNTEKNDSSSNDQDDAEESESMRYESYSPPPAEAFNNTAAQLPTGPSTANASPSRNAEPNIVDATSEIPAAERIRDSESYSPPPPAFTSLQIPYHPQHSFQASQLDGAQSGSQQSKNTSGRNGANSMSRSERKKQRQKNREAKRAASQNQPQAPKSNKESQPQNATGQDQPQTNSRKRRREGEVEENPRHVSGPSTLPQAPSPLPYIKQEPVSPPPMQYSHEPSRRVVLHDDGRADIENLAPHSQPRAPRLLNAGYSTEQVTRPSLMGDRRYFEPETIYIDSPDVSQPPLRRPVARDTVELRRVASLQNAARPMTATTAGSRYYRPDEIQYVSDQGHSIYQGAYPAQQYMWEEEISPRPLSRAPTTYRMRDSQNHEYYTVEDASTRMMPPPPKRRIIVDEYGNEYIAVPARSTSLRASEMPEMPPSYGEPRPTARLPQEAYYDTSQFAPSSQQQQQQAYLIDRQPSVIRQRPLTQQVIEIDDDEEDEYQRMAPPPARLMPRKRVASSNIVSGIGASAPTVASPMPRAMSHYPNPAMSNRSASLQPTMTAMGAGMGYGGSVGGSNREMQYREPAPIPRPMIPFNQTNATTVNNNMYDGSAVYSPQQPQLMRSYSTRPPSQLQHMQQPQVQPQQYMSFENTWR